MSEMPIRQQTAL